MTLPGVRLMLVCAVFLTGVGASLPAQQIVPDGPFSRRDAVDAFVEYSNTSSHIELGQSRDRKLLAVGFGYSRRLLLRRRLDLQYHAELRPVMFESDPLVHASYAVATTALEPGGPMMLQYERTNRQTGPCAAGTAVETFKDKQGNLLATDTISTTCGREWTPGQALSPVGVKLNLLPTRRVQTVVTALGGYLFSTHPLPIDNAGSYNFTFEFGGGVEIYSRQQSAGFFGDRSVRLEYRVHHISNKKTADANPGIDNGVLQITYAFGR